MKFYNLLLFCSLISCTPNDNKNGQILQRKKSFKAYLLEEQKRSNCKKENMNIFLGFNFEMGNNKFKKQQINLVKEGKLYYDYTKKLSYNFLFEQNKCEAYLNSEFIGDNLSAISFNYYAPEGISDEEIEKQSIDFLNKIYGKYTTVELSDSSTAINVPIYHWIKPNGHITYSNATSALSKHFIELKSIRWELVEIRQEEEFKKYLEKDKKSNGKSSKDDFN